MSNHGHGGYGAHPPQYGHYPPQPHPHQGQHGGHYSGKRKSRWDQTGAKTFVPGIPNLMPVFLSKEAQEAFTIRVRVDEITHKLTTNQLDLDPERDRSPSPEPTYDKEGKRLNTRDQRVREKLMRERQKLIERAQDMYPQFKPPADYKPLPVKRQKKLYIPLKRYPDYNFIGLIIGPRGMTQKTMEKETGCKIAIRGKGSVKDGKNKGQPGDDDDLHVLISAETDETLAQATLLVQKLLVPVEESKNEHKRQQLRKLAEYNGTLRDNAWRDTGRNFTTGIEVTCGICGEVSHPTADCPLKGQTNIKTRLDREYESFLSEIGTGGGGGGGGAGGGGGVDKSYEEFMSSIGGGNPASSSGGGGAAPWSSGAGGGSAAAPPPWASGGGGGGGGAPAPWATPAAAAAAPWQQAPPAGGPPPPWGAPPGVPGYGYPPGGYPPPGAAYPGQGYPPPQYPGQGYPPRPDGDVNAAADAFLNSMK